jgi:predicted esterase
LKGQPASYSPQVEVVRIPLRALEAKGAAWEALAALTAPKLGDHACTVICLHNLNEHTPWDGGEYLFALPPGYGTVRVVFVLADACSWHDYPDVSSYYGGVAWVDILDMRSMDRTDLLIERLVEHEISLLGGQSERVVLMGMSQGGGQSMLRFLRSRQPLGGWIGCVCHVPTAPHVPLRSDPLLAEAGRWPFANAERPMRLLSGELDSTFPAQLVLRDIARLRRAGFTDVQVEIRKGLQHEGMLDRIQAEERGEDLGWEPPLELVYLQSQLPSMVRPFSSSPPEPPSPSEASAQSQ